MRTNEIGLSKYGRHDNALGFETHNFLLLKLVMNDNVCINDLIYKAGVVYVK